MQNKKFGFSRKYWLILCFLLKNIMKTLKIEWLHFEKDGEICKRCDNTGKEIREIVARLNKECATEGVRIRFSERKLDEPEIAASNLMLIDGEPLENLLADAYASNSSCSSCGEITGKDELCRTVEQSDYVYETIPQKLIREAVCQVAECCQYP